MNIDDDGYAPVLLGISVLANVLLAFGLLSALSNVSNQKDEAIKTGAAYYHPVSGAFTWREREEDTHAE